MTRKPNPLPVVLAGLLCLSPDSLMAALTDCATSWSNFNNPGFISEYTSQGQIIADEETSADSSHGPAAVTPSWTDLASGSPGSYPGPEATSYFGYYNGGTVYDPNDPATMEDDYILFRMRVEGDPSTGPAFDSKHWNVLFDVDGDGYKEYWVDLDGSVASGNKPDNLKILYDNTNRQDIPNPDAAQVEVFTAYNTADNDPSCGGSSPGLSHTRVIATNDGTGDYWIEMQIPMTAFNDGMGNQVVYPDSPIAFVFSTGASNQDPLQKDFMQDLNFLSLADPITFGDIIIPNGRPLIDFTDANLDSVNFYSVGQDVYIYLTDPAANTDPDTVQCITVTVSDPSTGDDEIVTLCESGPSSGIFTNRGGTCQATITNPNPAPSPPTAWLVGVTTSANTITEDWTLTYDAANGNWIVTGVNVLGTQTARASHGVPYTSDGGEISFTLYENGPANGTVLSFCTFAADPLPTATGTATDDDGTLQVVSGDDIYVSYTNPNLITVTDTVPILGSCEALVVFTRATGLPSSSFALAADPLLSDQLYVTVYHAEANTDPTVAETLTVVLTGNDTQTLTLTETGVDTGEFRNTTGLQTQIDDGVVTAEDNLWEDVDTGTVTATYDYMCGGAPFSANSQASLFYTSGGGRVSFTNGAGTLDVDLYGNDEPVWVKVTDADACATPEGTLQVTITTDAGDSETVTVYETFAGSGVYLSGRSDLVTTMGSAIVTSASSDFVADGVQPGDTITIASGPDRGIHTVFLRNSPTQLTLTQTLTATRTGLTFSTSPLMTATSDGSIVADDGVLEADDQDTITVSYADCNDGDADSTNDVKIDTALYNAPSLLINEVLFYPDTSPSSCQTEAVELYNASSTPITATGYTITDEDGFSYVVPQLSGADIVLQPGELIYLSLFDASAPSDFYLSGTYYLFTVAGSTFPSDQFADPANSDPADQITLFDTSGIAVDYFGWSSTLNPSLDFLSDDSPAVLRTIWQDDAFASSTGIPLASSMARTSDGFDTNQPSDWSIVTNNTCQIIVTRAFISSFRVFKERGQVVVEWETSSENGSIGFYLYRLSAEGNRYVQVTPELVPALLDSPQGGVYRVIDPGAQGNELTYVLMEAEASPGGTKPLFHGPYNVSTQDEAAAGPRPERRVGQPEEAFAHPVEGHGAQENATSRSSQHLRAGPGSRRAQGRPRVKLTVEQRGLYSSTSHELAAYFAMPIATVERWLDKGLFRLSHRGQPVAWKAESGRLLFWGEPVDSIYTSENVYWLEPGPGVEMTSSPPSHRSTAPSTLELFTDEVDYEEDRFAATLVTSDPESDYWYWSYVSSGHPTYKRTSFTVPVVDPGKVDARDRIAVRVFGATDTSNGQRQDHHARVYVNGVPVGEARWGGIGSHLLEGTFGQGLLHEGDNTIEVEGLLDTGAPFSIFYVDGFELTYQRKLHANGAQFVFHADATGEVTVSGLSQPAITVLEVTNPLRPTIVSGRVTRGSDGYGVTLSVDAGAIYAVVADDGIRPAAAKVDVPSTLRSPSNAADYAVVTPDSFLSGANALSELRRGRGLDTMVVRLEDVMDEFNDGISTPHAIREFLIYAHRNWAKPPRFVVLAGSGNLDYKNALGLGSNPLPPLMVATPDGLYASDNQFGDVDGDGWPDIVVGRIPAATSSELEGYVAKLTAHEARGASMVSHGPLLVADDDPWTSARFDWDSEAMAASVPKRIESERIYLTEIPATDARSRLMARLSAGVPWMNYVGHGGLDRLADEALLKTTDVSQLGNGERLFVVTGFSCSINRFELAGLQSLGEALVVEPNGGAAAVWAPSGLSLNVEARVLGSAFFESVFQNGGATLGEAILESFATYRDKRGNPLVPKIYNFLGDPAVPLE
jgi:hypothetical protein